MRVVGLTDIGLQRKRNEDGYLIDREKGLLVVCDGMGGHKGGHIASSIALDVLNSTYSPESPEEIPVALTNSIQIANEAIWKKAQSDLRLNEMGTTVTAAVIHGAQLYVAHVGDSCLYLIRDHSIHKLTVDHTIAQKMLEDGLIEEKDRRSNPYNHVLTRALGVERSTLVDLIKQDIQEEDRILLCTDGLTDLMDENEILEILILKRDIETAARALVDTALSRGGHDNVTVVLLLVELGGK